jgi:dTDP-4-dehydrorhamnose 3,5-epimerase
VELKSLNIPGAWLAYSPIWEDERGSFREWFKSADVLSETGLDFSAAQANLSESKRGVIRGVHYSLATVGQAKWVTCVAGSIRDVIVDIRPDSATFGKYEFVDLTGRDGQAVLIGAGLGHGFISKVDGSIVAYLVSSPFSPLEEFEINPLDPDIGIDWGVSINEVTLSSKDRMAPTLSENKSRGNLPSESLKSI